MFSVGEFAKIAQVSKRQLRYYDELGLFTPAEVQENGRRFYRAAQLSALNRILVLQQLGLSLEQVRTLVRDDVPLEELKGMLKLKQAESEQRILDEQQRHRAIASRLQQIERAEDDLPLDVVVKAVPALRVLSVRNTISLEEGSRMFYGLIQHFVEEKQVRYGSFFIRLFGNDYDTDNLDGEIGRVVIDGVPSPLELTKGGPRLTLTDLPAQKHMATYIVEGASHDVHLGYSAIGTWAEANNYTLLETSREMLLQVPRDDSKSAVIEVQVPVSRSLDLSTASQVE